MNKLCEIAPGRFAHASGALWLAPSRTAVVADAHLGYGWAQRRRGELGPVTDAKSPQRLAALVSELQPLRLVFLGDLVHAPRPAAPERDNIEQTLTQLAAGVELILVRGNHDRAFLRDFGHLGVKVVECWQQEGIVALHGDALTRSAIPEGHLLLGHLHPVMRIRDSAGAAQKLHLFLVSAPLTVLPAFSPYSAGFDINGGLPAELAERIGTNRIEGVAVTGRNAVCLGDLNRLQRDLGSELSPFARFGKKKAARPADPA